MIKNSLEDIIRNSIVGGSLFLISSYIYLRVSVYPTEEKYKNKFLVFIGCLSSSLCFVVLNWINTAGAQILCYLFPSIFFTVLEKEKLVPKFIVSFFSSCFARVISFIPTVLISFILFQLKINPNRILLFITVYFFTFLITFLLLNIKRFKKGFQFFQKEKYMGIGLAISSAIFVLLCIVYSFNYIEKIFEIITVLVLVTSSWGFYLWIHRSITAHYRERLQLKSEEHYQELLKEKEQEIEKLNQSNEFLAKIVHRDNHLMSALNTSINAYFKSEDSEFKDSLLREIQTLAKERGELIEKSQRDSKLLPSTGNLLIDGAVNDLFIKAAAHRIDLDLTVSSTTDEIIGKYISQTDLQTLISDHIKDAMIAVETIGAENGRILVELSEKNGSYAITVFDNGVDFEIATLAKLGKECVTTHAENGGSGIGFMTTFETLRKAHASLVITEFENKTPFSKSIAFIFNGDNNFIIQSYRSSQLKAAINRDDVIIL